jgi:hypothetical protein
MYHSVLGKHPWDIWKFGSCAHLSGVLITYRGARLTPNAEHGHFSGTLRYARSIHRKYLSSTVLSLLVQLYLRHLSECPALTVPQMVKI